MDSKGIVIAYYSKVGLLTADFITLVKFLKVHYKVVLVYVGDIYNRDDLVDDIPLIRYGDVGYDLNCFLMGFNYLSKRFLVSQFIFFNNSIQVTDNDRFLNLVVTIFEKLRVNSLVGVIKSFEVVPHYQSFCFGISLEEFDKSALMRLNAISSTNTACSRDEVITYFELRTIILADKFLLTHDYVYKPNLVEYFLGFISFLANMGFFDNLIALFQPWKINPTTFLKCTLESKFGFRKIKSSSIINKLKNANKSTKISFR